MYDIFQTRKVICNLRSQTDLASNCINTNKFGLNLLRHFASNKWNKALLEIKNSGSTKDCYYYLICKTYKNNPGFVSVI